MNQKDLYPVASAQYEPIELSNSKLVKSCRDGVTALRQTALHSGYTQEDLAMKIGKQKKVLSRALMGTAGLPVDTLIKMMKESNSVFLLEYMCKEMGGKFTFISDEERELEELEQRVAAIKAKKAA